MSLATSQESKDLATRENSLPESSLHHLPDLFKNIAATRNSPNQNNLPWISRAHSRNASSLRVVKKRTAKCSKRPLSLLIGANMPAVLSEISFVSNASDESMLLESGQRHRVAEGLYRGVAAYLDSMQSPLRPKQKLVSENHPAASAIRLK